MAKDLARSEHQCTNGNECPLSNSECQWPDCRSAGRDSVLEEAAKVADEMAVNRDRVSTAQGYVCRLIADRIRSLKQEGGEEADRAHAIQDDEDQLLLDYKHAPNDKR
jgi:hypothetical protein